MYGPANFRAPLWIRSAHLKWLYRLRLEPRRSVSRYHVGDSLFSWEHCAVVVRSKRRDPVELEQ
ncbi:WecB/TagA/CpsF family glycosyltransferase [Bradyrhizobium icense]|uniref:WecB/TagA/CpsF family glycosyltransferase n=1 Tax=Bradyrhizobium icense TaxID=1274631 RepID=UPI0012EAFC87